MRLAGCAIVGLVGTVVLACILALVAVDIAARIHGPGFNPPWTSRGESVDVDTGNPIAHGEALYQENCSGCHSVDGSSRTGPTFRGLYGSKVETESGDTIVVDEAHLRTSITDPGADIRAGYPRVMPSFDGFDEAELNALVSFIRSLA